MLLGKSLEPPDLLIATLTGVVTSSDQATLVAWVRERVQAVGSVRVLVHLERFAGWKPDASFDSAALWLRDDEGVTRIAFVGAAAWATAVRTVIAQPLRAIPIAYFEKEAAARRWLGADAQGTTNAMST